MLTLQIKESLMNEVHIESISVRDTHMHKVKQTRSIVTEKVRVHISLIRQLIGLSFAQ